MRHAPVFALVCALIALPCAALAQGEPGGDAQAPRVLQRIELSDGQTLQGYVTDRGTEYDIELTDGQRFTLPAEAIKTLSKSDGVPSGGAKNTHRTRYLYSPSGMMLRAGEGYVSQKELLFTSFGYGVTDFLSIELGGALPFWAIEPPNGINIIAGVKLGGSPLEWLHLSTGFQTVVFPNSLAGGSSGPTPFLLPFGNVTIGTPDAHVSLNAAVPTNADGFEPGAVITTLSGYYKVNETFGLVSENWYVVSPVAQGGAIVPSLAGRFTPGNFTIDAGALWPLAFSGRGDVEPFPFPIPWVDFSWNFGG